MANPNKHNPSHMAAKKQSGPGAGGQKNRPQKQKGAGRPRREPLNDHYYYEEPSNGAHQGFEDVSSYSSPEKRREDQRAQKKQAKKKGSVKKKAAVILAIVLVLAGAGLYYVFGYMLGGLTMKEISKDKQTLGIHAEAQTDTSIKNIALFGLDARENEDEGRSDALMILSVDNKHGKLKLISILRDSNVSIEGYGEDKITHAYAYGGPELAIQTLNRNFHLDIEDYVTVNFIQMAEIVDAFGGTKVHISYDEMNEINANLALLQSESNDANILESDYMYEDGDVTLNGNQAVAYARIRHLEGGDDMRASRQQNVLKGLVEQMKGKSKLEYPDLIHKIMPMCETSLDFADIMAMSPIMFTNFTMETLSVPGEEENAYGGFNEAGGWVYLYDVEAASHHINRFIYEEDSPYYGEQPVSANLAGSDQAGAYGSAHSSGKSSSSDDDAEPSDDSSETSESGYEEPGGWEGGDEGAGDSPENGDVYSSESSESENEASDESSESWSEGEGNSSDAWDDGGGEFAPEYEDGGDSPVSSSQAEQF